jgi:hypothetical protein
MSGPFDIHPLPAVPSAAHLFTLLISSNNERGLLATML